MEKEDETIKLRLVAGDFDFVRPYVEACIGGVEFTEEAARYTAVVCDADDVAAMAGRYPEAAVLGCRWLIGTGMTGLPRELAARVWRGTFFHVPGCEIPVSAVHAVDMARAVALTLGRPGIYMVTDGCGHTLDELADAFAWRLGQKRVLTAPVRLARWLPGRSFRSKCAAMDTIDGSDFARLFDFKPVNVAEYLRTHVYDETSL